VVLLVLVGGAAAFVILKKPAQRPASAANVPTTPERVARGKYIVEATCTHCHTAFEPTRWSFMGDPAKKGSGGLCWDETMEFPGRVCSANLTSDQETGLGAWTDGEILRAIREGVSRDGRALVPIMPYKDYQAMSDEDAEAIVAYLRTLPAIKNPQPKPEVKGPFAIIMKFLPKPLEAAVPAVDRADSLAQGRYLATVFGCKSCHTPVDERHVPLPGKDFSGGQKFTTPWATVLSANITPHDTGLGARTKENFVATFKAFDSPDLWDAKVEPARNTVMPWLTLAAVTEEDLGAIYDYLKTVPPVANTVARIAPPAPSAAPSAEAAPPAP
jgi:mono/diheme cytochrome c family protein